MLDIKELTPIYDSRKSFYGKAKVVTDKRGQYLTSYDTVVARITNKNNGYTIPAYAEVYGDYSQTTLRHIKEFLKQNGFKAESKAQILKDYLA